MCEAHRLLHRSNLGSRVLKKEKINLDARRLEEESLSVGLRHVVVLLALERRDLHAVPGGKS